MRLEIRGRFCILILLLCWHGAQAQGQPASPFSNLRYKSVPVQDSLLVDTVSIARGSFSIHGVPDSQYVFDPEQALLVWLKKPTQDSVAVRYRVLPYSLTKVFHKKPYSLIDSTIVSRIYRATDANPEAFTSFSQLEYNGSYGRSISLGNNQDVVLNSQFNLQANGYILDSVRLEAAITDNTIPFQPEGNTQRLQEFDQIYIKLSKNRHLLQLGDYNLENPPGYFLRYFKRVQGIYYQTEFNMGTGATNRVGVSGSVAKGQFARNIFQGQEGNQGPYKLTGNNGEQFFIVLAATERVYVDNILMERGENADYVINYNTGEVRFMPRRMITKDSRIQVEFEYQDRNYLNSLIYAYDELQVGQKWKIRFDLYSNQDAKNQPFLQNLSGEQKRFLAGIGDSVHQAFYPNVVTDTFAPNKILYRLTDTTVSGITYDSVFVYSIHPDSARYSLSFSFVGEGQGNYRISSANANGRVYEWIAPINGIRQGNFEPVQLLVTPKMQQVFTLAAQYQIDSSKVLNVELATSNTDSNLFSDRDQQAHWGMASKIQYAESRSLGEKDSSGLARWKWNNQISYEFVQDRFKAIAPFRNVEFNRDWNVPFEGPRPDEHLVYATTKLSNDRAGSMGYNFSWYQRGADYRGVRNIFSYDYNRKRIRGGILGNLLQAEDTFQRSGFFRPVAFAEYQIPALRNTYLGGRYELEHNEIRNKEGGQLLPNAFSFDVLTAYLRTPEQQKTTWTLSWFTRRDRAVRNDQFHQQNHSNNIDLRLGFYQWKNHQLNFTGTWRQLVVDDTSISNLRPEETLLGRLEYTGSLLGNVVSLNTLYEFGSGQEQKQSYTYVEVPAGQGMYTWNDYNGDNVQQANEFEVAIYQDQKRFVKVFTPTNEYVKVNYVSYNLSVGIDPGYFWQGKEPLRWQKFLSRFTSQTQLQISNRLLADEGLRAYNPFLDVLRDASIILTNSALSNNIYFNRNNSRWGLDYNQIFNTGKQLLVYGVEGNSQQQHLYRARWNIVRPLTVLLSGRHGTRSYQSAIEDKRTYEVQTWSAEPAITWIHRSLLRLTLSYKQEQRENAVVYGGEHAGLKSLNFELRYSRPTTGVIQARLGLTEIEFNGVVTDPVAFVMLDALQRGSNYTWYLNWERRIGKGIELSLEYEGRKPGDTEIIHTGRMSLRAIL